MSGHGAYPELMTDAECIQRAYMYLGKAGVAWQEPLTVHNFQKFIGASADAVKYGMSAQERGHDRRLDKWAERLVKLSYDFDSRVKADPLIVYQPRTPKHASFHESTAFMNYVISANGIGKTLMAYVQNIRCATGQGKYFDNRGNVVIVSTGHAGYSEKVFITKMITGEDDDPYSPYVPEGGYWFHSFDQRKYLLRVACPQCAEAGKPRDCTHTKSIHCLSADSGMDRLMGFTARLAHVDEHIDVYVFREIMQRVLRVFGNINITATPLAGPDAWEVKDLYNLWYEYPEKNTITLKNGQKAKYVEVLQISKYDCIGTHNGPTAESIEKERLTLPPSEFRARVMGEPVPLTEHPVFDTAILDAMEEKFCTAPEVGYLALKDKVTVENLEYAEDMSWQPTVHIDDKRAFKGLSVWKHPVKGGQYAIGFDTASGVNSKYADASAAYVFKLNPSADGSTIELDHVATYYNHEDVYSYAVQAKILCTYYNQALAIPEVVGIGIPFMTILFRQLCYPNVYLGETSPEQLAAGGEAYFGVRTSAQSKPLMVVALQEYIHKSKIIIRDKYAISECRTFEQMKSDSGLSYRYSASNGAHDDRVLAMAFVCYACRQAKDQILAYSLSPTEKVKEKSAADPYARPKPYLF